MYLASFEYGLFYFYRKVFIAIGTSATAALSAFIGHAIKKWMKNSGRSCGCSCVGAGAVVNTTATAAASTTVSVATAVKVPVQVSGDRVVHRLATLKP